MRIGLTVNGRRVEADVAPRTSLADFVREELLLTGTHLGCEHGICGACTVEIDGEIARACITFAVTCDGAQVRTIEAFDQDAVMGSLRQAFAQEHALQCGYCTPGMLIAARDLVRRRHGLSREEIRVEMSGNLCRCTGYMGIVNAIGHVMAAAPAPEPRPARAWLGPAPGPAPVMAPVMAPVTGPAHEKPVASAAPVPAAARPQVTAPRRQPPIHITVGGIEETGAGVRLSQWFRLEHPREAVWHILADPEAAARCMPGAQLDGPPQDGRIAGRIAVKLGPIAATFAGGGTVEQFPAEHRQIIAGRGGDRKSGSRVTGSVDYRLAAIAGTDGREATRVDIVIGYQLTGMLAQFGRSNLARDLTARMGEAFAQNLDARLHGDAGATAGPAPIGAMSLVWQVISARARALMQRLLGR